MTTADAWAAADAEAAELLDGRAEGDYVYEWDDEPDQPSEMAIASARTALRSAGLTIESDDRGLRIVRLPAL